MTLHKNAIILLSGGADSATTLYKAKEMGFALYAMSFLYGQRHSIELELAKKIAQNISVQQHKIVNIDLGSFGHSALTDLNIAVPKERNIQKTEIPITYVPARNTIFLSYALAYAEIIGSFDIFIGANIVDYSGYPDCRPEYIEAFCTMANLATKASVEGKNKFTIHTPLINMTKSQIIKEGLRLGVNFANTISCYDPDANGRSCRKCDSCQIRIKAFLENHIEDPSL